MALGSIDGHGVPVFAIEPHAASTGEPGGRAGPPDRAAFFEAMLATGAWEVVRLVSLISEVVTAGWDRPVSLLWIDGDHAYEAVASDYRCWEGQLTEGAVVAFDGTGSPALGPARLVAELIEGGRWRVDGEVGEMTVLAPGRLSRPRVEPERGEPSMPDWGRQITFGCFPIPKAGGDPVAVAVEAERFGLNWARGPGPPVSASVPRHLRAAVGHGGGDRADRGVSRRRLSPSAPPGDDGQGRRQHRLLSGGRFELGLGAGAFWDAIAAYGGDAT